jgi:RNA polymerase primary sigma factor
MFNSFVISNEIINRNSEFDAYMREVRRYKQLSKEDEMSFIIKAQGGDDKAREQVIKANLLFVVSVSKQYQGLGLDLLDLINEGNIGLIRAIDKFDTDRDYKFITFAVGEIRGAIAEAINQKSRTVRLKNRERLTNTTVSGDTTLSDEEGDKTLFDTMSTGDRADACFDNEYAVKKIQQLLSRLNERDKDIITKLFGIGCRQHTQLEMSMMYHMSEERIRQIKFEILGKMKEVA